MTKRKSEAAAPEEPEESVPSRKGPGGYPLVRFDPEQRCNYHLDESGRRRYHGVPAGFAFTAEGRLMPILPSAEPAAPTE